MKCYPKLPGISGMLLALSENNSCHHIIFAENRNYPILSTFERFFHPAVEFSDSAKALPGNNPAIWGSDFINWAIRSWTEIVEEANKNQKKVYLITLMWQRRNRQMTRPYDFLKKNVKQNDRLLNGTSFDYTWYRFE